MLDRIKEAGISKSVIQYIHMDKWSSINELQVVYPLYLLHVL